MRSGSAPQLLAALRNLVIGMLRLNGIKNIAAALRHYGLETLGDPDSDRPTAQQLKDPGLRRRRLHHEGMLVQIDGSLHPGWRTEDQS